MESDGEFPRYQISGFDDRRVWQVVIRSNDPQEINTMQKWASEALKKINDGYAQQDQLDKSGSFEASLEGGEHDCPKCGWKSEFAKGISMKTGKPRPWQGYRCLNPDCGEMQWKRPAGK